MECHNWRNCEGVCEDCEIANMDPAEAFRKWTSEMLETIGPDEALAHLQALARRALTAEQERDRLRGLVKELIDNDPYEQISDGGSVVLDAWRHEAKKVLEGKE